MRTPFRCEGEHHNNAESRTRTPRTFVLLGAAALTLLVGTGVEAQVNIEKMRKGLEGNGVAGSIDASATGRTGNSQGLVAGGAAQLHWRMERHSGLVYGSGDYARINNMTTISRSLLHARYGFRFLPRWSWELFAQQQTDRFRLLRSRELAGSGPRFGIVQSRQFDLFLGTAYMLEYEKINVQRAASDAPSGTAQRWTSYVSTSLLQGDHFSASTTIYIQPRFDRFRDFRLLNETSLVVEINSVLATRVSVSVRSDSEPPTGVVPTDVELKNSLVLKF